MTGNALAAEREAGGGEEAVILRKMVVDRAAEQGLIARRGDLRIIGQTRSIFINGILHAETARLGGHQFAESIFVAAQRAKHILQGSRPYGNSRFTKETTIALDEVLRGEAKYLVGKEARDAMKEAKRGKEGETERMAMMTGEDAREIKKELSVYVDDSPKPAEADAEE